MTMDQGLVRQATADELPPVPGVEDLLHSGQARPTFGVPQFEVVEVKKANGEFEKVEYVSITIPGDPTSSPRHKVTEAIIAKYKPYYDRWKAGQASAAYGTPLEMCPFLKPNQIRVLKAANIFTAEDLESIADANLHRIPGGISLRQQAKEFLENKRAFAAAGASPDEVEALRETVGSLEAEMEKMRKQNEELMAAKAPAKAPVQNSPKPAAK